MVVLFLSRNECVVYDVSSNASKKTLKYRFGLASSDVSQQILLIRKKLKINSVRVVLSDEISYLIQFSLEKPGKNIRDVVRARMQTEIPETLEENEWDYKVLKKDKNTVTILAFAPTLSIWRPLQQMMQKEGIQITAVEPEYISRHHHPDPILGIAKKKDLQGKDEDTLNLTINSRKSNKKWVIILLTLFIIVVIIGVLYYFNLYIK